MPWPLNNRTLELRHWGLLLCWLLALCLAPPFWCLYTLMLLHRYLATVLAGRKCVPLHAMDAIIGQELDSPNCMINALLFLEGRVDAAANFTRFYEQVVAAEEEPAGSNRKRFPNFSRCLSYRYGFLTWCQVDAVDAPLHLYEHPQVLTTEEQLQSITNVYFNQVLPADRPPWELVMVHLAPGWRAPRYVGEVVPSAAWLWRIHHSITDGVSLIRIMSEVLATNRDRLRGSLLKTVGPLPEWARPPSTSSHRNKLMLRGLLHIVYFFVKNFFERDRGFLLGRRVTHRKNYVWSRPVPLSRVRAVRHAAGAGAGFTVNDVVMSCVAGALRTFLAAEFDGAVPERLRAYVPVSFQALDAPVTAGNQFVCPAIKLATGQADPRQRLDATKRAADQLKKEMQYRISDFTTRLAGRGFNRRIMPMCLVPMTPSVTFSNMAGSPLALELDGCRLADSFIFTPNSFIMGVSIAITSYCDSFTITVVMDTGINQQLDAARSLVRMVEDELELLERTVQQQQADAEPPQTKTTPPSDYSITIDTY